MKDIVIDIAMIVAGASLAISALLPTTAWVSCTMYKGGTTCEKTMDKASAGWNALGSIAMGVAINQRRKGRSE